MEKQKRWQFYLILAVLILTLYNILPTIFYYTKPLKSPVDQARSEQVAAEITHRINDLEQDAIDWIYSYGKLLSAKPETVQVDPTNPQIMTVKFSTEQDATRFKRWLPQAGALIPFAPAQLELASDQENDPKVAHVLRRIPVRLDSNELANYFQYIPKYNEDGKVSEPYKQWVNDRIAHLAMSYGGESYQAMQVAYLLQKNSPQANEVALNLATDIVEMQKSFGLASPIAKRYFSSFTQGNFAKEGTAQKLIAQMENAKVDFNKKIEDVLKQKNNETKEIQRDSSQQMSLAALENERQILDSAINILKNSPSLFESGKAPLTAQAIDKELNAPKASGFLQEISLQGRNPYIEALIIDWSNDKILLKLYKDVQDLRQTEVASESSAFIKEKMNQYVLNEIARGARDADENVAPYLDNFAVSLTNLQNPNSFLSFDLGYVAQKEVEEVENQLLHTWQPVHPDLTHDAYPVRSFSAFKKESPENQRLGLVVYAPSMYKETPPQGFRTGSIYVIAKGMENIVEKYKEAANAPENKVLLEDLNALKKILSEWSFIGYSGATVGIAPEFAKDFIFELDDYYSPLIKASREDFSVKGSKRLALLPFTDVEQRIITHNQIEDRTQEDLIKAIEEYQVAQVDINGTNRYLVPAPTKNPYWENFKISFKKYFQGDDRKILKWGLDLSGGKTVRIGLVDHNNQPVTNPDDLHQAANELYGRLNKMGVSERTIRVENQTILLEFPGAQGLSAADLVKASAMSFHVVNEKFTPQNAALKDHVNQFLQSVWNEAVVTNQKDADSINRIAWNHLGGLQAAGEMRPISESARILYENGLRLANPNENKMSSAFDDEISSIGVIRGDDFAEWDGQTHPLLVMFHNYALEGSNLTQIQVGYDASEGNTLSFAVKNSYEGSQEGSPRDAFYAWTSQFSEDKITGTSKEAYSHGRGWRMAVILNGSIISKPTLRAALRDSATISGRFSQREVNQLAADLKAGSLSFTPKILSEQNVSAELGTEERSKGILAAVIGVALVVFAMIAYYHFAGLVAACAVLLNLLIMWGVLQNLDAALTLPAIAGIVLTIGMAVDANVLVFERIREEFAVSGRIASAIQAGYRKAFSAIFDSNLTTIIAAVILIQFDSGPIKGFAVTLIIGIISSMFTALFMTRYFFAGWVQNPQNKSLSMSQFIGNTHFDFLAQTKKAVTISLILMIIGGYFFIEQRKTIFGMDFTGGYALTVEVAPQNNVPSYRIEALDALLAKGASSRDVQVRELSTPNQLRVQLGMGMEEKGEPFYQMPEHLTEGKFAYNYQKDPRLTWVVQALEQGGLSIPNSELEKIESQWTTMSGQFSDAMRNNALIGLLIALVSILIYITFRFEFKYAVSAVVGLAHDVIITLGILAIFHLLGFPVQIDLQVIGAIMTIIGYSLNDTIIVFDRIREDLRIMRKMSFKEVINHALNVTLSRTLMTSGTTLLVLLALVLFGGTSIFGFSLVMTIGVLVGTLSSLFITTPMLLYLHNREEAEHTQEVTGLKKRTS